MDGEGLDLDEKSGEGDKAILESMKTGDGLIQITSEDQLLALARAATETKNYFDKIAMNITQPQAVMIRSWRVENGCTWRRIAELAHESGFLGGDWSPPGNQLMGMSLCEMAAKVFGEDCMREPWN